MIIDWIKEKYNRLIEMVAIYESEKMKEIIKTDLEREEENRRLTLLSRKFINRKR